jgi:hypothetical protein
MKIIPKIRHALLMLVLPSLVSGQILSPDSIVKAIATHDENQARFVRDFRGKVIRGNMLVAAVRESFLERGAFVVELTLQNGSEASCKISHTTSKELIAGLNRGAVISVDGKIDDVFFGAVILEPCEVKQREGLGKK